MENLPYSPDEGGKYTYYVTETNEQLEGYLAPTYSNVSAPTGVDVAYDGGTIINQQEGGVELPHTSGPGTAPFTILGTVLLALVGACAIAKKRRRSTEA